MSAAAWGMLIVTWGLIVFFTARFFWKVLTIPVAEGAAAGRGDEETD